jgi:polyisoprenoid-binding protein YceI
VTLTEFSELNQNVDIKFSAHGEILRKTFRMYAQESKDMKSVWEQEKTKLNLMAKFG